MNPKKIKVEEEDAGIPILFEPQEWDIEEELMDNEAFREHNSLGEDE